MANILIIEDDPYFVDDVKFFLDNAGHKCEVFSNADEVMKNIDHLAKYDTILLDIMMRKGKALSSVKGSFETGELLLQHILENHPGKMVIIISAMNLEDMKLNMSQYPTVTFFQKPFDADMINKILELLK